MILLSEIKCSLCGATMKHKKLRGNEFWECPECKAETWPYDERVEKAVHKAMYSIKGAKKKVSGSRRKKRHKIKKPGEKWIPWYRR